jgi:hypothetical protein
MAKADGPSRSVSGGAFVTVHILALLHCCAARTAKIRLPRPSLRDASFRAGQLCLLTEYMRGVGRLNYSRRALPGRAVAPGRVAPQPHCKSTLARSLYLVSSLTDLALIYDRNSLDPLVHVMGPLSPRVHPRLFHNELEQLQEQREVVKNELEELQEQRELVKNELEQLQEQCELVKNELEYTSVVPRVSVRSLLKCFSPNLWLHLQT